MAGIKISNLPEGGTLLPTDQLPVARSTSTLKIFGSVFLNEFQSLRTLINQVSGATIPQVVGPNRVLAGPVGGAPNIPQFRPIVIQDLPVLSASNVPLGTFAVNQIPSLPASKINSEVFNPDRIPNLNTSKIINGVFPIERGGTGASTVEDARTNLGLGVFATLSGPISVDRGGTGATTAEDARTNLGLGTLATVNTPVPVNQGGTGTFVASPNRFFGGPSSGVTQQAPTFRTLVSQDIPGLDATKIATGTINVDRIPDLDAVKVATGVLNVLRIPNLDASKITSGVLTSTRIPNLDASKIVSGVLNQEIIPDLNGSKITSGFINVQRIPNLDASKITSGGIPTDRIANSAITPFKLSLGAPMWTTTGEVTVQGDLIAGGNVTAFSDQRLKEDIKTIKNALSTLKELRGVSFIRKGTKRKEIGVIGQEIKEVLPEVTFENEDGYISVAYGNIVSLLIEAVKELADEVKELKQQKAEL